MKKKSDNLHDCYSLVESYRWLPAIYLEAKIHQAFSGSVQGRAIDK
jgi:hypothetical protein